MDDRRLLDPAPRFDEFQHTRYGLWSNDAMVPPSHLGQSFAGSHTHFRTSGSNTVDSQDMDDMIRRVTEHGYGRFGSQGGSWSSSPTQTRLTTRRSRGRASRAPSARSPSSTSCCLRPPRPTSRLSTSSAVAPSACERLQVLGSNGDARLIESHCISASYVIVAATGGLDSDCNPVGFREHPNVAYQGLRHIPGRGPYPIVDSFYARGFGVGVRHRGAAVAMRVTTNGSYTTPTIQT